MAGTKNPGGDFLLHSNRQFEQPEHISDHRPGPPQLVRQFALGDPEFFEQLFVRCCFFEGVELDAVHVFQQRVAEHGVVIGFANNSGNGVEPGLGGSPPAPFAHDQFVPIAGSPHHNGLKQPEFLDGVDELVKVEVVKDFAGIFGVGVDEVGGDFLVVGGELSFGHDFQLRPQCRTCGGFFGVGFWLVGTADNDVCGIITQSGVWLVGDERSQPPP